MNPYGKFQRLKNEEADFDMDEEMSLFSKAPSSASRHPPSSLGNPRLGWGMTLGLCLEHKGIGEWVKSFPHINSWPGMSSSPPHEPYYEEPMRMPGLLSPRDWDKKSVASSAAPSAGGTIILSEHFTQVGSQLFHGCFVDLATAKFQLNTYWRETLIAFPSAPLFSPLIRRSPSLNDLKEDHDPFNYNSWKGKWDLFTARCAGYKSLMLKSSHWRRVLHFSRPRWRPVV